VPINFRLAPAEIQYIVGHSGAEVVYADPACKDTLDTLDVPHKFVLGDDDALYLRGVEPQPWGAPDEAATATINYTSGTTARPKGVQLTHRNLWLNATVFGLHFTISDRDVLLHTLPMFHANGWGMPFGITGVGGYVEDGYLVISDRKKDVIITGGENVSSIEVEDALMSHPAVREVAVIGIPDEKWGELVTGLVVLAGDTPSGEGSAVTGEELITHCRGSLAGYKCPKRIEFVETLPRTATGKLQKFKLREPYWAGRDRQVH
jgi:acyl-CoA synthetase (AMP-forming)/AMP-acid ligase II